MIIREKREEDLNFIMSIASSTGSEPDEIKEILERDEIYVAELDGQLAGFVSLRKNESILKITELAIAPQFQNKGFARELLSYVRELAGSRGVKELWVRTSNDNIPALTLYQKFGFRILDIKLGAFG
jgi:ribosomal protein S18 acetylase RimI-like enzyme